MTRRVRITRRQALAVGAGALAAPFVARVAMAAEPVHGISAFGELKYPPGFPHFDYVNPNAPKGGTFPQLAGAGGSTFNSLNAFILKGDPAIGIDDTFASMMVRAADEPDAMYGLAAESVTVTDNGNLFRFKLRSGITFHDGSPITAADVVWSLNALKTKGHPAIAATLRDLEQIEADGDRDVVLRFAPRRGRDAPLIAAGSPIFSRAFYARVPFEESSLEPPLGSGPYRVGRFEQGRFMEFERVRDWWGADLPVMRGQNNFDVLRYEYYRDRDVAFEGFSAGTYLFREEFTSRAWATRYDFPAMRDGRVKRETIPDERPSGAQGWMINTRRGKFAEPRLREALALAFDFEWTNKNIMFGSYSRTHSYFQNSAMAATGQPSAEELALLEPFRDRLPAEVFGEPWTPPVSDGSGQDRNLLRRAGQLLDAAGWTIKDRRRTNAQGDKLAIEFLMYERSFEPHHQTYAKNLQILGIEATLRLVDAVQYRARLEDFDFDMTVSRMVFPQTPGDSLRTYFSSQAARTKGTFNLAGIADPVVDALIERVIAANSRADMTAACRALDRVLRAGRYWVPHWSKASHWIAYWDVFGRPDTKPRYSRGIPDTWWRDPAKAAKVGRG